jgi:hypothetical protein
MLIFDMLLVISSLTLFFTHMLFVNSNPFFFDAVIYLLRLFVTIAVSSANKKKGRSPCRVSVEFNLLDVKYYK